MLLNALNMSILPIERRRQAQGVVYDQRWLSRNALGYGQGFYRTGCGRDQR